MAPLQTAIKVADTPAKPSRRDWAVAQNLLDSGISLATLRATVALASLRCKSRPEAELRSSRFTLWPTSSPLPGTCRKIRPIPAMSSTPTSNSVRFFPSRPSPFDPSPPPKKRGPPPEPRPFRQPLTSVLPCGKATMRSAAIYAADSSLP
jgi:hypothetical protein